jgi:glycosyltransferase involved in cell wall biosynthesis
VPDLQHEYFPEYFPPDQLAWRRERIPESVELADAVITYTQFSARGLLEKLGTDKNKLHIIPAGGFTDEEIAAAPGRTPSASEGPVAGAPTRTPSASEGPVAGAPTRTPSASEGPVAGAPTRTPSASEGPVAGAQGSDHSALAHLAGKPFIFYPAADWPHKNHETLINALALLTERGRPEHLALSGMLSQRGGALRELAEERGIADRVHFLGCVSQDELIALYRAATLMAFPSRFEGFGIPLIEAMQLGCPVVASKSAAIPETAANAAVYCNDNPASWAEGIEQVCSLPVMRRNLQARGYTRANEYDWNRSAQLHLALFRRAATTNRATASVCEM